MALRMKLTVAYDGRSFHGWQEQRDRMTIQGELRSALASLFGGRDVAVVGAGRTDAGVHAAGQIAHFDAPGPIPSEALARGLNARLPPQIRVLAARPVSASFHARRSALGKRYTYRGRWSEARLPWLEPRSAAVPSIALPEHFAAAVDLLAGRHDWASFTVRNPSTESTVRTLYRVHVRHLRNGVDLEFCGEGFLRYQVRRMVGALFEVGSGERDIEGLRRLICEPQPGAPIRTAPAHGLCLEHVFYRRCAAISGVRRQNP